MFGQSDCLTIFTPAHYQDETIPVMKRAPRQRKGESWHHYAWRCECFAIQKWQRDQFAIVRGKIADQVYQETTKQADLTTPRPEASEDDVAFFFNVSFGLERAIKYRLGFYVNDAATHYLMKNVLPRMSRRMGLPVPNFILDKRPVRSADKCMQGRDHRCFFPYGKANWNIVSWYEPLDDRYLPLRDLQPKWQRHQFNKRFCCREAAFFFVEELCRQNYEDVMVRGSSNLELVKEDLTDQIFGTAMCQRD